MTSNDQHGGNQQPGGNQQSAGFQSSGAPQTSGAQPPSGAQQPNYSEHLRRVRQVKRTLDTESPLTPAERAKMQPKGRDHISHESMQDQAVSRKTRRPAEDYDIAKAIQGVHESPPAQAPLPAQSAQGTAPAVQQQFGQQQPVQQQQVQQQQFQQQLVQQQQAQQQQFQQQQFQQQQAQQQQQPAQQHQQQAGQQAVQQQPPQQFAAPQKPVENRAQATFASPEPGKQDAPRKGKSTHFVPKTLMDHNAILKAQLMRQKARVEQQIAERKKHPVKPVEPVKAQKSVRSCPFSWTDDSATGERFKYCTKCQASIYNFEGLDIADAEKLILKRENLRKFVLFKRPDGKFMTSDCPVEKKRKQQFVGVVALCICLIACIAGFLIFMPPQSSNNANNTWGEPAPNPVSSSNWSDDAPVDAKSSESNSSATKSGDGAQHYEAGDALPTEPDSGVSTSKPVQKPVSESEEKGDFWEFSAP